MFTKLNILLSSNIIDDTEDIVKNIHNIIHEDYSHIISHYLNQLSLPEQNRTVIYRSHLASGSYFMSKPKFRKSLGSNNIHTVLMSELLPLWKNYPRRDKSFICSTESSSFMVYIDGTGNYNKETRTFYIVFPKNNAKLAICPENDLWTSFFNIEQKVEWNNLTDFDDGLATTLADILIILNINFFNNKKTANLRNNIVNKIENLSADNKVEEIKKLFRTIEIGVNTSDIEFNIYEQPLMNYLVNKIKKGGTIIKALNLLMSPRNNNFNLINTTCLESLKRNVEVWTDSECFFMTPYIFSSYMNWLKNK